MMLDYYELHEPIGYGGMGVVYAATEHLSGGKTQPVACKVMKRSFRKYDRLVEQFHHEAEINRLISHDHPGLVTLHRYFRDVDGLDYQIMDLVEGGSLADLRQSDERLSFDAIRLMARDVLDVLTCVHEHNVVHRDISAGNVLVSKEGKVKIADFGLAKEPTFTSQVREQKSAFRGKPAYVSPEVVAGRGADQRADLYSFAVVLYEMLSGRTPQGSQVSVVDLESRLDKPWHVPPLPDDVPDDLRELVMGLLRRHPHERVAQTAAQARALLREPLDPASARAELAHVFEEIFQESRRTQRYRGQGSLTGVRITALHVASERMHNGSVTPHQRRQTRHRMMPRAGTAMIAFFAIAALFLSVFTLRTVSTTRPTHTITEPAAEPNQSEAPTEGIDPAAESVPTIADDAARSDDIIEEATPISHPAKHRRTRRSTPDPARKRRVEPSGSSTQGRGVYFLDLSSGIGPTHRHESYDHDTTSRTRSWYLAR